ncbi:MAG: hypothetical protein U5K31_01445 [Balneolaceae bacterium]|nr:hypothetical protein [Balneolaceae bacterium]
MGYQKVSSEACPLLVPLAEEGWTDNQVARDTLDIYLERFEESDIDSLILGCTHYPLFKKSIRQALSNKQIRHHRFRPIHCGHVS